MEKIYTIVLGVLVFILALFLLLVFQGWIFSLLWNWIIPIFWTSAPILTIWDGVGITILFNIVYNLLHK